MKQETLDRVASGATAFDLRLSLDQLKQLDTYAEELKKWNKKINLTAITADNDIVIKHFLDSLSVAKFVRVGARLLDVGSGAGFPCIPLKVVRPDLFVTSIDAVEKKILFQRHVARMLSLTGFDAIHGRAELLASTREWAFDVVVSRAFSDLLTFLHIAGPVLKEDGLVVAMKGKEGKGEARISEATIEEAGFFIHEVEEFVLPYSGDGRSLIILSKK